MPLIILDSLAPEQSNLLRSVGGLLPCKAILRIRARKTNRVKTISEVGCISVALAFYNSVLLNPVQTT